MKSKIPIMIGALVLLAILLYLNHKGIIKWQMLTMIAAVVAAPIKFLSNWLKGNNERIEEIKQSHDTLRRNEETFRESREDELKKNDEIIKAQSKKIEELNSKITAIEAKKQTVDDEIENMSEREQIQLANELFGGEK